MWRRQRVTDLELVQLSALVSGVEEVDTQVFPPDFGSVRYVDSRPVSITKVGWPAVEPEPESPAEMTVMIDDKFITKLDQWLGPIEPRAVTLLVAEKNLADPEFPEDLKAILAEALEGWRRVEANNADIFATLSVLSLRIGPADPIFDYF